MICNSFWYAWTAQDTPSRLLVEMRQQAALPPQLSALVGVPQCPERHPEGDVFIHTCFVCDAMASLCSENGIVGDRRATLMLAALTHDFGKPGTTKFDEVKLRWTSHGHDIAGVEPASQFLEKIGTFSETLLMISRLVRWHMSHCVKDLGDKGFRKLVRSLHPARFQELILLIEADCSGRPPLPPGLPDSAVRLNDMWLKLGFDR